MTLATQSKEDARPGILPPTVLVVDDDRQALAALQRTFRNEPFELILTDDPFNALDWIKGRDIDLVISDEFMPSMLGTELMEAARIHSPDTAMVLLTGYPNMAVSYRGFQQRVDLLIVKPWNEGELRKQARRLLAERGWQDPDAPSDEPGGVE
jgi:response regulator RpfG family c-di-GMP phosphodiesterase